MLQNCIETVLQNCIAENINKILLVKYIPYIIYQNYFLEIITTMNKKIKREAGLYEEKKAKHDYIIGTFVTKGWPMQNRFKLNVLCGRYLDWIT